MIKLYSILFTAFLLGGCSFKTPKNEWQYKSTQAFNSYQKNFLSDNDVLAKSDLNRAINHAKQSADLTQLSRIYLSECSLNISHGIKDSCKNYTDIKELTNDKELEAYYAFITKTLSQENIQDLPKEYQEFAFSLSQKDYKKANTEILKIEKTTSALLAGVLLQEHIEAHTREYLLQRASYNGYKKSVLFCLDESLKYTQDEKQIKEIKKKISILKP